MNLWTWSTTLVCYPIPLPDYTFIDHGLVEAQPHLCHGMLNNAFSIDRKCMKLQANRACMAALHFCIVNPQKLHVPPYGASVTHWILF